MRGKEGQVREKKGSEGKVRVIQREKMVIQGKIGQMRGKGWVRGEIREMWENFGQVRGKEGLEKKIQLR